MKTAMAQLRSGFTGIEIILVLIIATVIGAVVRSCKSTPSGSQQSTTSSQVSGTAQGVKDTAQAGTAVLRLTREAGADAPDAIAPTVEPGVADPEVGGGVLDILEDIFEGL